MERKDGKELTVKASFVVMGALAAAMEDGSCYTRITEGRMQKKFGKEIDHPRRLLARIGRGEWVAGRAREKTEMKEGQTFYGKKSGNCILIPLVFAFGKKILF